jgi:hypothetical protein
VELEKLQLTSPSPKEPFFGGGGKWGGNGKK